jgi:1-acyl-sn-glycerol-3-phosphate acyltransferase
VNVLAAAHRLARVLVHLALGLWETHVRLPGRPDGERLAKVQWWAAGLLRCTGAELRLNGQLASGAVLVAANHVSWLDIVALHACEPRIRFVSKAAVGHWPLVGGLARVAGTLFIERERKRDAMRVVHEIAAALTHDDAVAVFPEGTTGPGDAVLAFHANLLQAAISTGTPVQPVMVRYSEPDRAVSTAAQYIGDTTLVGSVLKIVGARGLVVHVRFMEPMPVADLHRRELAQALQDQVSAQLAADLALERLRTRA